MLPDLSSLTLAPDGPCRPCGPRRPRRPAATGTTIYGAPGWQLEPCPICLDPLGEDSEANPWAPNPAPYAGACCANEHAYHKGCIRQLVDKNPNARCPTCRAAILPDLLYVPPPPIPRGIFTSSEALNAAVRELLALDRTGATPHPVHGPIGGWDVSRVTDMHFLFMGARAFNQPLNSWNVSNVENMALMFDNANSFNQPLDRWDVRKVESMAGMFSYASSFNQPLDGWDVRKVKFMDSMFKRAYSFNQDLCGWTLKADANTDSMFDGATAFNDDPTTRPPNCPGVFAGPERLQKAVRELLALDPTGATPHPVHGPIGGWNVSNVKGMYAMFRDAKEFNQPLDSWDVSNVETMIDMFSGATSFNQSLNSWVVSKVDRMTHMFQDAISFNQPLDAWDVSNVQIMEGMFGGAAAFNQPLNSWNVSKVRSTVGMFLNATSFNQDLCGWNLKDGASTAIMFEGATSFNRDPATRPPRRRSEAIAGRDCSPVARQRTGAAVGVALEDKRKLEAWYESSKPNLPFDRMSAMFLVGAVLARIEEVYGAEGQERVDAGIKHFLDDNDVLTVLSVLKDPGVDPAATKIAQRVQLAIMNAALREKQEEEARKVVDAENKKLAEDDQIVEGQVQGGGKCMFEIGRTKGSLKEEAGGSTCVRRQQSMQMIAEARRTLEMARARTRFPASLW